MANTQDLTLLADIIGISGSNVGIGTDNPVHKLR